MGPSGSDMINIYKTFVIINNVVVMAIYIERGQWFIVSVLIKQSWVNEIVQVAKCH